MSNRVVGIIITIIMILCWIAALVLHIIAVKMDIQPTWFNMFASDVGLIVLSVVILHDNITERD